MNGRVLVIAGSDSGGGAGLQADIKTIAALNGYAATAVTALTAQNTQGVFGVHQVPEPFIAEQIDLVLSDIGADCIKTGMLHSAKVIETVAYILQSYRDIKLVVDPVMIAKGGASLLEADAIDSLKSLLISRSYMVTPNIPEAEVLAGMRIGNVKHMQAAGHTICELGASYALIKGGHANGQVVHDVLCHKGQAHVFTSQRIDTNHTHGTGCTLASAIACGVAQQLSAHDAVERARNYVHNAIKTAPGFGTGHGPLNHAVSA